MKKSFFFISFLFTKVLFAEVYATVPQVLNGLFGVPHELIEKHAYFSREQIAEAKKSLGAETAFSSVMTYFEVKIHNKTVAYAWVDTHRVRTMNESILVTLDAKRNILDISVLSFLEPKEYSPKKAWLARFVGKSESSNQPLAVMTGATMSSDAISNSVAKVMYIQNHSGL